MEKEYVSSWSAQNSIEFYRSTRNKIEEVYKSEDFFLKKIIKPNMQILDVGCAAGGFSNILKSYEPTVRYTGTDTSEEMIKCARQIHPNIYFEVCGEGRLPFKDCSFDLVMCFGTLHMTKKWKDVLKECWRVCSEGVVFDLRIANGGKGINDITKSYMKIAFYDKWDGKSIVPYIILSPNTAFEAINELEPIVKNIETYGYLCPVSSMSVTPFKEVFMTSIYLTKK